jgi:hypothetical protein
MRTLYELVQVCLCGPSALLRACPGWKTQSEKKTRDGRKNRTPAHCGQGNARSLCQDYLFSLDDPSDPPPDRFLKVESP